MAKRLLVAYSGEREHPYRLNVNTSFAAFFKIVVACINYAATLLFSGFSFTDSTGVQLRVLHDHRVGFSIFSLDKARGGR